jgi:oligoribonuclease (3'-5' exoribonuclease)
MNYYSIDIETTGLDPVLHSILEIGIVEVIDCQIERTLRIVWVNQEDMVWTPYCLKLHAATGLIDELSSMYKPNTVYAEERETIIECLSNFLPSEKFNIAGKNFGVFDKLFLDEHLDFSRIFKHQRRYLDPAMMYVLKGDSKLPDLDTCLLRADIGSGVTHDALQDAMDVATLINKKLCGYDDTIQR